MTQDCPCCNGYMNDDGFCDTIGCVYNGNDEDSLTPDEEIIREKHKLILGFGEWLIKQTIYTTSETDKDGNKLYIIIISNMDIYGTIEQIYEFYLETLNK